jgi:hypothetical protein
MAEKRFTSDNESMIAGQLLTGNVRMGMIVWPIVIAVCVDDNREATEEIFAAENGSGDHSILRVPYGETVAEEIFALSSDFEANDDFPVSIPEEENNEKWDY